jgi:hypothetical protein
VAETALERGCELVFADNELLGDDVDSRLLALVKEPGPSEMTGRNKVFEETT